MIKHLKQQLREFTGVELFIALEQGVMFSHCYFQVDWVYYSGLVIFEYVGYNLFKTINHHTIFTLKQQAEDRQVRQDLDHTIHIAVVSYVCDARANFEFQGDWRLSWSFPGHIVSYFCNRNIIRFTNRSHLRKILGNIDLHLYIFFLFNQIINNRGWLGCWYRLWLLLYC